MSIKDAILNNLGWKIASLVLAIVTWFTLQPEKQAKQKDTSLTPAWLEETRVFPALPITLLIGSADDHVYRVSPPEVELKVSGRPEKMQNLEPGEIDVFVNLADPPPDSRFRKEVLVRLPDGISKVSVVPTHVYVERVSESPPDNPSTE